MRIFEMTKLIMKSVSRLYWLQLVLLAGIPLLSWQGCGYSRPANIPFVPVDITINIYDPQFVSLQGVGGYTMIPGGSRGIILYRASIDQFHAYERHCTYDPGNGCGIVGPDPSGIILEDTDCSIDQCGSKFNVIDGSVIQGPATFALLQYPTAFDGVLLRIYN